MKKYFWLMAFAAVLFTSVARAQCQPATDAQTASYERVVKALQSQFKENPPAGNWRIFDERHSLGKLEVSDEYGKMFRPCGDRYDLTLERGAAARERRARIDSAVAQADPTRQETSLVLSTDSVYKQAEPARARELGQNTVDINVEMNVANYRLQEPESNRFVDNYKAVQVKNAPMALQVSLKSVGDSGGLQPRPETVVFLGNWKNNLKKDSKGNMVYHYSFAKGGNLVENLVVTIKGPLDVAQEIIRKTDWQALSQTLIR
ncbi:hypothetical protein [Tellurirhabdus rosea]|uniref:hypothetical protein n=1 Tax=Tellurirhabdus rosea TaxID=2674997 RepID=UPI0022557BFD|nr:hypothetical protein [Tellurirhabdus rosea]